jgi:hypothetical protein
LGDIWGDEVVPWDFTFFFRPAAICPRFYFASLGRQAVEVGFFVRLSIRLGSLSVVLWFFEFYITRSPSSTFLCVSFLPTRPHSFVIVSPHALFHLHLSNFFLAFIPSSLYSSVPFFISIQTMDDPQTAFASQYPPYGFDIDMMKVSSGFSFELHR